MNCAAQQEQPPRPAKKKAVYSEAVTVARLPQRGVQKMVNRNSDQLFGFAFRELRR
jgi:hypothetical protein